MQPKKYPENIPIRKKRTTTNRMFRTGKRNSSKRKLSAYTIKTYEIINEACIENHVSKLIAAIKNGQTNIRILMGKQGDTGISRIRAVKIVKIALEDPSIHSSVGKILEHIDVDFVGNPYAGLSYKNLIMDEDIKSFEIKTN